MSTEMTGITPEWYTPDNQECDDENKKSYKVKPLNGIEFSDVLAECRRDDDGHLVLTARSKNMCISGGLIDWKNIRDKDGTVDFLQHNIKYAPGSQLYHVANKIFTISMLSEDAIKN